jgi:predicted permease
MEMEVEANLARGMSPLEAIRAARLTLGGADRFAEEVRDERGVRPMLDFGRDIRHSLRSLGRTPLFTFVVLLTLSLGIGSTTAVFSMLNGALLRPLPGIEREDELVLVQLRRDEWNHYGLALPSFLDVRAAVPAFSAMLGYNKIGLQVSAGGREPVNLWGDVVAGDYFSGLGVRPSRGRQFTEAELSGRGDPLVTILEFDAARDLFGVADPVGRTLRINGNTVTIVGVAERGFTGGDRAQRTSAWFPPHAYFPLYHYRDIDPDSRSLSTFRDLIGRLAPGATAEQAQQHVRAAVTRLRSAYPEETAVLERYTPVIHPRIGMHPQQLALLRELLRLLFGISALVLLIACANVSNLLLFRGVVRRGEAAVRRALGASTGRLLQQYFADGLIIACCGAAGGLLIAMALSRLLGAAPLLGSQQRLEIPLLDWRVLAFTSTIAAVVSLAFAAVPSLLTRRLDLVTSLRQVQRGETARFGWVRSGLVVVQLAASVALLVVSLLLTRTLHALNGVHIGYDPDRVIAFAVMDMQQGYDTRQSAELRQRLLESTRALPGVEHATVTASAPFSGMGFRGRLALPGEELREGAQVDVHFVGGTFFDVLGVGLLAGRAFTSVEDRDSAAVIILNRTAALRLFGHTDVVGASVNGGFRSGTKQVVGVVDDLRHGDVREAVGPAVYLPLSLHESPGFHLLVSTAAPRAAVERSLQRALAGLDPDLPFYTVNLLSEGMQQMIVRERFLSRATALLAVIAGLLAAVGLYGMLAYAVAQRTREIGIRIALGARPAALVGWITARMTVITVVGLALGMAGGAALGRLARAHLYGVSPHDPVSNVGAALLLALIGCMAAALPARAAVRVPPATVLRSD